MDALSADRSPRPETRSRGSSSGPRGAVLRGGDGPHAYRPGDPRPRERVVPPRRIARDLEVPETLQALIAARLDGLGPQERRLLQDAAVLGRTFTLQGLVAITGLPEGEVSALLTSLVGKEVL